MVPGLLAGEERGSQGRAFTVGPTCLNSVAVWFETLTLGLIYKMVSHRTRGLPQPGVLTTCEFL